MSRDTTEPGGNQATAARSPTATAFTALSQVCCAWRSVDSTLYIRKPACEPRCPSCLKPADFCCSCFCCECCADCCCKCCDLRRSVCCAGVWQLTLGGLIGSGYAAITTLSFQFEPGFVDANAAFYALLIHLLVFWWLYCLTGIVGCCTSLDRQGIVTYDPRVILMARVYLGLNLLCAVCHVTLALLNRGLWGELLTRINIFLTFLPLVWDWYIVYLAWSFITKLKEQRKGVFRGRPLMHTQRKPGELLELHTGQNLELTPPPHQVIIPLALAAPTSPQQGPATRRGRNQSEARWSAPSGDTVACGAAIAGGPAGAMGRNFRSVTVGAAGDGGVGAADGGTDGDGDGGRAASRTDRSDVSSLWNMTDNSYSGGGGGGGTAAAGSSTWGGALLRHVRDSDSGGGSHDGGDQYYGDGEADGEVDGGVGRRYPSGHSVRGEVEAAGIERRSPGRLPAFAAAAAGSQRGGGPEPGLGLGLGPAHKAGGTSAEALSVPEVADSLAAIQEEDTTHAYGTSGPRRSPGQQRRAPRQQQDGDPGPPPPPGRPRRKAAPDDAPYTAAAPPSLGRRTGAALSHSEGAPERSLAAASRSRTAVVSDGTADPASVGAQGAAPAAVFELRNMWTRPSLGGAPVSPVCTSPGVASAGSRSWRSGASGGALQMGSAGVRPTFAGAKPRNPPLPTLEPVVLSVPVAPTYGGALFTGPHTGRSSGGGFGVSGGGGSGSGDDGRGGMDRHRVYDDIGGGDVVLSTATPPMRKAPSLSRRALFLQQVLLQRSQGAAAPARGAAAAPTDPTFPIPAPERPSAPPAGPGRQGLPSPGDTHLLRQRPTPAGTAAGSRTPPPSLQGVPVRMVDPDLAPDAGQPSPPLPLPRMPTRPRAAAAAPPPPLSESASGPSAVVTLTLAATPGAVLPPRSGTVSAATSSVHLPSHGSGATAVGSTTARAFAADGSKKDGRTSPQDAAAAAAVLRTPTADSTPLLPPSSPGLLQLPPPPPPPLQLPTPTAFHKVGSWTDRYHRSDDGLLPSRPSAPTPGAGLSGQVQQHRLAQTRRTGSQPRQSEQGQGLQQQHMPPPHHPALAHPSLPLLHHHQHQHHQMQQQQQQQQHYYQPRDNVGAPLPGREFLPPPWSTRGSSNGGGSDGGAGNVSDGGGSAAAGGRAGPDRGPHALGAIAKLLASSSARSLHTIWGDISSPPLGFVATTAPPSPPPQPGKALLVATATDIVQPPPPSPPPGEWAPDQLTDGAGGVTGSLRTVFQLHTRTPPQPQPVPPLQLPPHPLSQQQPPSPSPVRVLPRAQSYSEPSYKPVQRMPRPVSGASRPQFPAAAVGLQGYARTQAVIQHQQHQQHQQHPQLTALQSQFPHSETAASSVLDSRTPSNTPPSLMVWAQDATREDGGTRAADGGGGIGIGGGGSGGLGVPRNPKYDLLPSSPGADSPKVPHGQHRYPHHHQHLRQQRQQLMAARRVGGGTVPTTTRFWQQQHQQQHQQQGAPGGREGMAADPGTGNDSAGSEGEDGGTTPAARLPQGVGGLAARAGASAAALWGVISGDWRAQRWQDDREEALAGPATTVGSAGPAGRSGNVAGARGTWEAGAASGGGAGGLEQARQMMTHGSVLLSQGGARLGTMASTLLGPNGLPAAMRTVRAGAATLYDKVVPNVSYLPHKDRTERGVSAAFSFWGPGWAHRVGTASTASTATLRGGPGTASAGAGGSAATAGSGLSLSFGGGTGPVDSRTTGGALGALRPHTPVTPISEITPCSDEDDSGADP